MKLINDTLGHAEGDRYLQTGANLLKDALRASDILARVGGDEFAIILPQTDREAAEELVTRLRKRAEALQELERCAGAQFDPQLVEKFLKLIE